jgi:hypothetical protein
LILEDEVEAPKVLIKSPILLVDEPQTLVHRFPVFNRRNTPRSSSTSPLTSSSEEPRRIRNLEDLYDATQVMEDTNLFCFFTDSDPLSFNEAII